MSQVKVNSISTWTGNDVTIETGKTVSGTASQFKMTDVVQGDVLYGSAADTLSRLPAGTSGQVLKTQGAGANPQWAADVGGKILQIVQTVDTTNEETTTSTSFVTTNVSVTITPTSSSSDMLVMANGGTVKVPGNGGYCNTTIYRGGTDLSAGPNGMSVEGQSYSGLAAGPSGFDFRRPESLCFLDTARASGVSAVTYTIYFRVSSQTATYNDVDSPMTLTVMEIDA